VKRLLSAGILFALALPAADLTGKWTGTMERVGGPPAGVRTDDHFVVLKQSGNTVSGTAGPKRDVQWEIVSAKLDGAKLVFETAAPAPSKLALVYDLELANGEFEGTVNMKSAAGVSWKLHLKREQ